MGQIRKVKNSCGVKLFTIVKYFPFVMQTVAMRFLAPNTNWRCRSCQRINTINCQRFVNQLSFGVITAGGPSIEYSSDDDGTFYMDLWETEVIYLYCGCWVWRYNGIVLERKIKGWIHFLRQQRMFLKFFSFWSTGKARWATHLRPHKVLGWSLNYFSINITMKTKSNNKTGIYLGSLLVCFVMSFFILCTRFLFRIK